MVDAYIAAGVAMLVFGIPAALQQQRCSPIITDPPKGIEIDGVRVFIVALARVPAIVVNVVANVKFPEDADRLPCIGTSV